MRAHLFELCPVYAYSWRNPDWERTWGDPSQGPSHQQQVPLAQQARPVVSGNAWGQDACWFRGKEASKAGNCSQCRERSWKLLAEGPRTERPGCGVRPVRRASWELLPGLRGWGGGSGPGPGPGGARRGRGAESEPRWARPASGSWLRGLW